MSNVADKIEELQVLTLETAGGGWGWEIVCETDLLRINPELP